MPNTNIDNLPGSDNDGIDDQWRKDYFGLPPNPIAGPQSRFTLNIAPVPGQPGWKQVIFRPRLDGRTYEVRAKASLSAPTWDAISASAPSDADEVRTITDLNASGPATFERIKIAKP